MVSLLNGNVPEDRRYFPWTGKDRFLPLVWGDFASMDRWQELAALTADKWWSDYQAKEEATKAWERDRRLLIECKAARRDAFYDAQFLSALRFPTPALPPGVYERYAAAHYFMHSPTVLVDTNRPAWNHSGASADEIFADMKEMLDKIPSQVSPDMYEVGKWRDEPVDMSPFDKNKYRK